MAEDGYKYDEDGFREDLKNDPNVLHQPDADRTSWKLKVLSYDETIDVLNGDTKVQPEFKFSDEVLDKIVKEKPELKSDEDIKNLIKDKDQQILLARYNEDQANNQTISPDSEAQDKEQLRRGWEKTRRFFSSSFLRLVKNKLSKISVH